MKTLKVISAGALGLVLTGCLNLPQTKALITPVGVVGIHSFAPPRDPLRGVDFIEQRRLARETTDAQRQKPPG